MISLNNILNEVLASSYIKTMEFLINEINWGLLDNEFGEVKENTFKLIDEIKSIHNYSGENAEIRLVKLKNQSKDFIYVLKNILENQQ